MRQTPHTFALLLLLGFTCHGNTQTYETNNVIVQTFVGSGFQGHLDGQGVETMFERPDAMVADRAGNLYVADRSNIRKVTRDGKVSTFASLPPSAPVGSLAIDRSSNVWAAIAASTKVARISPDGVITMVELGREQKKLCFDSTDGLYFSSGRVIYRLSEGEVEVFAGSGNDGLVDGRGIFSSFSAPTTLAVDAADNIYVFDSGFLRRVTQNRDVETIAGNLYGDERDGAGTNAVFSLVAGMCTDAQGNIYLASYSYYGSNVRKVTATTNVTTIAGSFAQAGFADGAGITARFYHPCGICSVDGTLFVSDSENFRVRRIVFSPTEDPVPPANLELATYPGLRITGTVGRTYRIESSTSGELWTPVQTLLLRNNPHLWVDPSPAAGTKLYRVFMLP